MAPLSLWRTTLDSLWNINRPASTAGLRVTLRISFVEALRLGEHTAPAMPPSNLTSASRIKNFTTCGNGMSFCCHDGPFLWLRTWHQVIYNGDQMEHGIHGYVFPVLVTGMRQAGWEPDVGAFFLEHSPHCGPWPVHVTKSTVWQQLLSTSLGPAFCVCTPSYATVRYSPPFHDTVLAC